MKFTPGALGDRAFSFRQKPHFPGKITPEFLLVDLLNNLDTLAEDTNNVEEQVGRKVKTMDTKKLKFAVNKYGNAKTKKFFYATFQSQAV